MNKQECSIVKDLYVLYDAGELNIETREMIDTHLAQCASCRKVYESKQFTNAPTTDSDISTNEDIQQLLGLKEMQKATTRNMRIRTILMTLFGILFFIALFCVVNGSSIYLLGLSTLFVVPGIRALVNRRLNGVYANNDVKLEFSQGEHCTIEKVNSNDPCIHRVQYVYKISNHNLVINERRYKYILDKESHTLNIYSQDGSISLAKDS